MGRTAALQCLLLSMLTAVILMPSQNAWAQSSLITYRTMAIRDRVPGLRQQFSSEQLELLEKLNRSDLKYLDRQRAIVIPDTWVANELAYSVLPAWYPSSQSVPKLLVVYLPSQIFGAYERGRLVQWGPVSSGRQSSPTPEGLFSLNWRARKHVSTVDPDWLMPWTFNFENKVGVSFHEYELPGYPASHSCIRLLGRDARWLFDWGEPWRLDAAEIHVLEPGTRVFVVAQYDFDSPPPWHPVDGRLQIVELPELPTSFDP